MAKVSVIIPVYGVEKYIERCAISLFSQTLDDIEYLFIDDCTPDNSIAILKQVLEEYPHRKSQVIIYKMEQNSGQAAVREWGMRNATGEFVTHCDSDDWVVKDMYKDMYEKAILEKSDCVICDYAISDGVNIIKKEIGCDNTERNVFIQNLLSQNKAWSLCNKLFKRALSKNIIYPKGNMGEDMVITFQSLLNANVISYIPKVYYYYYQNPSSITHISSEEKKMKNFCHNKDNLDLLISIFKRKGLFQQYEKEFISLKYVVKMMLINTSFDKKTRYIWYNTYPEIKKMILINPYIQKKEKIKFILTNVGIYPWNKG